jgi:hypothetical protein
MKTKHKFKHICVDPGPFKKVKTINQFVKLAREQSYTQSYYHNPADRPTKGADKYFGDAFEALWEVMSVTSENDKRINCYDYWPAQIDEFAIDGRAKFYFENNTAGKLGVQCKNTSDPDKYYNTTDEGSNIGNAVAGIAVHQVDRILFVNTGKGVHPKLLETFNQNKINLVQLNKDDLAKLFNHTPVWQTFYESLLDKS